MRHHSDFRRSHHWISCRARGSAKPFRCVPRPSYLREGRRWRIPLSVIAGKKRMMNLIPEKRVIHAGTFNGNPITLAAARATLTVLNARGGAALRSIRKLGERLMGGIR